MPDALDYIDEILAAIPELADLYFTLFVQYRNLKTGANTITRSGLTSPAGALQPSSHDISYFVEWPAISPIDKNPSMVDAKGNSVGLFPQTPDQMRDKYSVHVPEKEIDKGGAGSAISGDKNSVVK